MKKMIFLAILTSLNLVVSMGYAQTLTWSARGVGGGWYAIAGGISNIVNEKSGGITIKVIPGVAP